MIFFGTSAFSIHVLNRLLALGIKPEIVVTVPDKPQGRKLVLTPPPVKVWAEAHNIPTLQFAKLNDEAVGTLSALHSDIYIVASYGKIIPQSVLDIPTKGCLNIHPSLLPKYRGASPLQTSILEDQQHTGVVVIKMDKEMDHGPIVTECEVTISPWPLSVTELEERLAIVGADILAEALPKYMDGTLTPKEQDHMQATFTKKIEKEDGEISLDSLGWKTYLKYKAYDVWPGIYFFADRKGTKIRIKVKAASWNEAALTMDIERVLPEGKNEMNWKEFQNYLHT
jgi:methionyl-tRNA formyltransferase